MDIATLEARIESLVAPIVAGLGMEIADLEFLRASGRWLLRLSVDYPQGGVTIDDCARVSRSIAGVLDVEGEIPGAYHLEVSSPGLDRRLRRRTDFERYRGRVVDVQTRVPLQGRSHYKGPLAAVTEQAIVVVVDGVSYTIPMEQVAKARLRYFAT